MRHHRSRAVASIAVGAWLAGALALPVAALAQRAVSLRIGPKVGETLYTRFEQDVEMSGTTRMHDADTTITQKISMLLLSHSLVQSRDERGVVLLTVTDSMSVEGLATAVPSVHGKRARMRISPNGSATLLDSPDDLTPEVQAVFSGMPSTLPDRPVPVRGTWEKVMAIPVAGEGDPAHAAQLHAVYRLDSLSGDGGVAYISMRGTITRDSSAAPIAGGVRVASLGSVNGTMRMDRSAGWWTESSLSITVRSTLTPSDGGTPTRMITRIVQHMRTEPHR